MKNRKKVYAAFLALLLVVSTLMSDISQVGNVYASEIQTDDSDKFTAEAYTDIATVKSNADTKNACTVKGQVTFIDGKNIYIQDETGGIDVYLPKANSEIKVGNILTATGTYALFNGLAELSVSSVDDYNIAESTEALPCETKTVKEILDDDGCTKALQAKRILLENVTIGAINTSDNTVLTQKNADGTESTINVYKIPALDSVNVTEGDTVSIIVVVSYYKALQLRVASASDVTLVAKGEVTEPDPEPEPEEPETTKQASLVTSISDGNVVLLNHKSSGNLLTTTASGSKLAGTTATISDDKVNITDDAAQLTVCASEDGHYLFTCAGKYLTSSATGNGVSFTDAANDYSLWDVEAADKNGTFYIKNVNAAYNGNAQALEYYKGFTTYGANTTEVYQFQFYLVKRGNPSVQVDDSITNTLAKWSGGSIGGGSADTNEKFAAISEAMAVYADESQAQDMKDTSAKFIVIAGGKASIPTSSNTSVKEDENKYIGATGVGAKTGDYMQYELSSEKYGKLAMKFRIYGTKATAAEYQLQYSTDGTNFDNFENGTYKYEYTDYSSGTGVATKKEGTASEGIVKVYKEKAYMDYTFDIPSGASNAEKLYIRFVPGNKAINGGTSIGGNVRMDGVEITGSPVVSSSICKPVKATPDSGKVAIGSEVSLSSATEGAVIYYSIDGGEKQVYNADSKITLSQLPATIETYASKDGISDSITMKYQYSQAQVATVKATPNGGAVSKGTNVVFRCSTEGAKVLVSSDEGNTWDEIKDNKLVLSELPASYMAKAVKDGYKESETITVSFTEKANEKYNIYFGQLHSHTNYSDGAGSCEEAYQYASKVDNLDFLAVTDHSNSLDGADTSNINTNTAGEWTDGHALADKYTTDTFVGIYGYEMTWSNGLGHMNTFNTLGFQSRTQDAYKTYSTALQNYYASLKTAPDSISQFNHPGTTFGDFSDFAYYDEEMDNLITTVEVGNGEGAIGSSGYFPSYEYYQRALDKGWHVAPTNNQDNHKGKWGDANTGRSVVLADSLTRENVYDAMRNYRVYATEDNDLNIYYTLDGYTMGSILEEGTTGDSVSLRVDLSDKTDESIGEVSVITNGGIVLDKKTVNTNEKTVTFDIDNNYSYYYIKVVEEDGDIAVTAPVWVGEVEAVGINDFSTTEVLPVKGEALDLNLEMYNNEDTDMELTSVEFAIGDKVIKTVDLEKEGLTKIASKATTTYSFDYTYEKVGNIEVTATVKGIINGAEKQYQGVVKLSYVSPNMVTRVIVDGTHYNDYVTGYYGGNMGNFTKIAGDKNIKVEIVKDEITKEMLDDCALLIISAPARKTGTAGAGDYVPSNFSDDFISMVKNYTDNGGTLITCGLADYQDSTSGQSSTEINKLLEGIGATTKINSDEAYDTENNGGQAYRLYLTNYNKDSRYLKGAVEGQEYSAYSGCTVKLDAAAVSAGKAEALVKGFDTTYSIDCKDENGNSVSGNPTYVQKGDMVAIAHETLASGANIFVSGTVCVSDFEVKAELDNAFDLPYLNRTIAENILDEVKKEMPVTSISKVRADGEMGEIFTIEGYVTSGTAVEGNKFFDTIYVQDDTAGITVFPYATAGLEVGTKVRITGYVDAYQGDKEIQVMSSEILDAPKKVYEPEKMTAKLAMNYSKSGGKLVQVEGKVVDILYDSAKTGISQLWLDDGSGEVANVFIDGYIYSATTGKNELASTIKAGDTVSAVGLVYAHPEGESDTPVICLRVRNVDEIVKIEQEEVKEENKQPESEKEEVEQTEPEKEEVKQPEAENVTTIVTEEKQPEKTTVEKSVNNQETSKKEIKAETITEQTTSKEIKEETDNTTEQTYVVEKGNWTEVNKVLANVKEGETVKVEMKRNAVLPQKTIEEIKGKDVAVEISVSDDVTWIINGQNISDANNGDIKLGVELNGNAIPTDTVNTVAKDKDVMQLSLEYDGEFGFEATLRVNTDKKQAGKYANLYYFNPETQKLELQMSGLVAEDGSVDFTFTHASDYVIVFDEVAHKQETGNNPFPIAAGVMVVVALGVAAVVYGKRKKAR